MIEAWCNNCGARFKVDDAMAGRTARCGRCQTRITIPEENDFVRFDEPLTLAGEEDPFEKLPLEAETIIEGDGGGEAPVMLDAAVDPAQLEKVKRRAVMAPEISERGFWQRLPGCFGFMFKGVNLLSFLLLWVFATPLFMLAGGGLWIFSCVAAFVMYGISLYMLFSVLLGSCEEEDRLMHMLPVADGGDLFKSIAMMFFSILWSVLPALLISLIVKFAVYRTGLFPLEPVDVVIILASLVLFWPMTMLVLAIYGFDFNTLRYDVAVVNICRTLGHYLAVSVSVIVCFALLTATSTFLPGGGNINWLASSGTGGQVLGYAATMLVKIYCYFTMMRIIGVYYLCNRHRFTWEQL